LDQIVAALKKMSYIKIMQKILIVLLLVFVGIFGLAEDVFAQQTATLFFSPSSQSIQAGSTFTVTVMVNTGGQQVNAVAAYFSYPVDKLQALQVTTTGSVLQFVAESTAGGGQVRIAGGSPTPGFLGTQRIGQVQFRAMSTLGSAQLSWSSDSAVLTDQGNQNILNIAASPSATFQITASQGDGSLLPPPPPTGGSTPPSSPQNEELAISDIRAERVSGQSVLLSWKTNEETKGQVNYGPTRQLAEQDEYPFSMLDGIFALEHSFSLSRVEPPEDYSLEIVATDESGNQAKTGRLVLSELLTEETTSPGTQEAGRGFEIAGFTISSPLFLAILLPIGAVVLLAVFLLVRRKR